MTEAQTTIQRCEDELDQALWSLEIKGEFEEALAAYCSVEATLEALGLGPEDPAYAEQQGLLAFCLMRKGNVLRQLGRTEESIATSEREIVAARASGDSLTLGRSLMSFGMNRILRGEIEKGVELLDEARSLFEGGDDYDHVQGLGWYWIARADLGNRGVLPGGPAEVIEAAGRALATLQPIENWPGIARAYAARAAAYEELGDSAAAAADREAQSKAEGLIAESEDDAS